MNITIENIRNIINDNPIATLSLIVALIIAISTGIYKIIKYKKGRWKKYSFDDIPIAALIPIGYAYDNKIYIKSPVDNKLDKWNKEKKQPLLLIGKTGIGKSRAVIEFLNRNKFQRKILIPSQEDISKKKPPKYGKDYILLLNDLHYLSNLNVYLPDLFINERLNIIGTIPLEKYDINNELFSNIYWEKYQVKEWKKGKGRRLAQKSKTQFNINEFNGTPLSILAPNSEMSQLYARTTQIEKNFLQNLLLTKLSINSFVDYSLINILMGEDLSKSCYYKVSDIWCIKQGKKVKLRDGYERHIDYSPTLGEIDDIKEVLILKSKISDREEYLFYMGNRFLLNEKRYEEAIDCYNQSIKINPNYIESWVNKGVALRKLLKYNDAIECLEKALEINPNIATMWCNKGHIYMKLLQFEDALQCIEKALEINPNLAIAWNNKSIIFMKLNRFEDALQCIEKSLEINPNLEMAWSNKGLIFMKLHQLEEALLYFEKAIGINPNLTTGYLNRGLIFMKLKEFDDALLSFEKTLEINPNLAIAWSNKGLLFMKLEKFEDALLCSEKALEINPNLAMAWNNKGLIFMKLQQFEDAQQCFEKTLEINPNLAMAWNNKGLIFMKLQQFIDAQQCFEKALEINPNLAMAWTNLGSITVELEKYEDALLCFEKALEINPNLAIVWHNKSIVFSLLNQMGKATKCYKKILSIKPESWNTYKGRWLYHILKVDWFNKGKQYFKERKYNEAINCFENILEINPSTTKSEQKILSIYKSGKYKKIIKYCNKVIESNPEHDKAWIYKGISHFRLGEYIDSIKCFENYLIITSRKISKLENKMNAYRY